MNNLALCYVDKDGVHLHSHNLNIDQAITETQRLSRHIRQFKIVTMDEDLSKSFMTAQKGLTARLLWREGVTMAQKYFGNVEM